MSALAARLSDFGDRLNPVLVREVRQALRGRFFLVTFSLTLVFAMVASIGVLILGDLGPRPGMTLFTACSAFLSLAACLLIPVSAFLSLGAEHDEQTRDLLVLSNLSPGQIVRGKFLTFFLLALLLTVALGPFLVLSALLNGVDLFLIAVQLADTLVRCVGFTLLALCLSALAPNRGVRGLLLLVMILFMFSFGMMSMTVGAMVGSGLVTPGAHLAGMSLFVLVAGSFLYTLACMRFTHPEENRSTPLRLQLSGSVFLLNVIILLFPKMGSGDFTLAGPASWSLSTDTVLISLAAFSFASLVFASESSILSRRVSVHVPISRLKLWIAYPFLPGGGKAVAWFLMNAGLYAALIILVETVGVSRSGHLMQGWVITVAVTLTAALFAPAVLPSLTRTTQRRFWLVSSTCVLVIGSTSVSELYHTVVHTGFGGEFWRIGSPLGLIGKVSYGGFQDQFAAVIFYTVLGGLSLVLNSVRMVREARELAAASSRRQAFLALAS